MDKKILVTMSGSAVLAILALVEKSAVMFVSAAAIAVIVYVFRRARMRDRVIAIIAAGLGGSIGAEIVRTFYHYSYVTEAGAESGDFFMAALLVGSIYAAVIVVLVLGTEVWVSYIGRDSG